MKEFNESDNNTSLDSAAETIKSIKRSFRLFMNGVAASSMREKGLDYKIIWGIPVTRIREMAAAYEPSREVAEQLWQSDVRECKLLAMMLMPADCCDEETVMTWVGECRNPEMAEMMAFYLLSQLPFADRLVERLLADEAAPSQLCAFHLVSRLATKGVSLSGKPAVAMLAQRAIEVFNGSDMTMKHAALNCVVRYAERNLACTELLVSELKKHEIDIF